ncbi:hypothetical protein ACCO45_003006 [Purpureocillium lilacinum]|uniref:Uncharacterized protein n=1 Tax=Purpureocillium lilacinum TaxID=33203 RepID=A0ACC4DZH6_PURLI
MAASIYKPLDNAVHEIRLLTPAPSQAKSGTEWTLRIVALDASPPLAALSYLWGEAAETVTIKINGQSMPVTANLASALRHVEQHWRQRFPGRDVAEFHLWVDAVCINQSDIAEREQQVKLMGRLYSTAELVMGSLGPSSDAIRVAIDTLRLVHGEVGQLDDDDSESLEANLSWMQKHAVLTDADQSPSSFFSEAQALDPDALFTTLQWFKTTRELAKLPDAPRRPHWLIPSIWNFLTYDNLLGWKAVLRIEWARNADRDSRFFKLLLSCAGNDLRATDPRDLIYGTMGLTRMGFEPDYSPSASLGELYARFMVWWLEQVSALQAEDEDWTLNHLDLLGQAGMGQVDDDGDDVKNKELMLSLPSWAPNFPLHANTYTPHILTTQKNADADIFPDDAPTPRVQGLSLFVPTILLDSIVKVDKVKATKQSHGLLCFVISYVSQHAAYPTGHPSLQGLFRTLMKDILGDARPEDRTVMTRFFGFVRALIHGPETGVIELKPEEALEKLGFSIESGAQFADSVRAVYLPDMDAETAAWAEKWLPLLLQPSWDGGWQDADVLDLCLRTVLETRELDYTSIATTERGTSAWCPSGARSVIRFA